MAAEKAPKQKTTRTGLGAVSGSGERPSEAPEPTVKLPPKESGASARHTLPVPIDPEPRARIASGPDIRTASSPPASQRRSRNPVAVDDVGDAAVELTSRPPGVAKPKVVKSRSELAGAPIDSRDAFLLSLIDGKSTVASLVDVSGMDEGEVSTILARLRRLGIITYG